MSLLPQALPSPRALAAVGLEPEYPAIRRTPEGLVDYDWYLLRARHLRSRSAGKAFGAIGRRLGAAFAAWVQALRAERERKRALAELLSLDDRGLRDLGLGRAGVYFAVDHGREDAAAPANANEPGSRAPKVA